MKKININFWEWKLYKWTRVNNVYAVMELCYKMIYNIVLWKNEAINDLENVVLDCDISF